MANKEQLERLKQGVAAWNTWREKHRDIRVELAGADLRDAYLRKANLSKANLSGAYLGRANLREANLNGANLNGAYLRGASLIDSMLNDAILTGSRLWETQRAGWSIKNVICEYVYWGRMGQEKTEYKPSEFEKLYSEKVKIVLHYKNGIDPMEIATLPALLQALGTERPGYKLRIQSIKDDAGGASVTIAIDEEDGQDMEQLEAKARQLQYVQRELLKEQETRLKYQHQLEFAENLLEKGMTKYKIEGPVGQVGDVRDNATVNVNQTNQTVYKQADIETIKAMIGEIASHKQELADVISPNELAELDTSLQTIEIQISMPEPNTSIVKEALGSVGRILEGATGSLLANEWLTMLIPVFQSLR